jgi:hypothetical protein
MLSASPIAKPGTEKLGVKGNTLAPMRRRGQAGSRAVRKRAGMERTLHEKTPAPRTSSVEDPLERMLSASDVARDYKDRFGIRATDAHDLAGRFQGLSTFPMSTELGWRMIFENITDKPLAGCVTNFGHGITVMTNGCGHNGMPAAELAAGAKLLNKASSIMTTNMNKKRGVSGNGEGVFNVGVRYRNTEPRQSKKPKIGESAWKCTDPVYRSWLHTLQRYANTGVLASMDWNRAQVEESIVNVMSLCGKGTASFAHPMCSLGLNTGAGVHLDKDFVQATWIAFGLVPVAFPELKVCIFLRTGDVITFPSACLYHAMIQVCNNDTSQATCSSLRPATHAAAGCLLFPRAHAAAGCLLFPSGTLCSQVFETESAHRSRKVRC